MTYRVWTIALFTLLEALRSRLSWLLVAIVLGGIGVVELIGAVAITETRQVQSGTLGALLRLCAVLVVTLFVITSMVRELNDKVLELVLALPIPRAAYYLGKLLGYALFSLIIASLFAALTAFYAPPSQAFYWGLSLAAELWLVTALSLLCLFSFNQVTVALSAVTAFYVLGRAIGAIQLLGHGGLAAQDELAQRLVNGLLDGIAFLLPDLYRFTPSEWLIYHTASVSDLLPIAAQTTAYLVLLVGATLFDLYRKAL